MTYGEHIIPLEVKSGNSGRLLSLHLFLEENNISFGIQVLTRSLQKENKILSIPAYMISEIPRLLSIEPSMLIKLNG